MSDEIPSLESARIESRQLPIFVRDVRTLAAEMGLEWRRVRELCAAGLLSFSPDSVVACDECCEAEFLFVGHLAAMGLSNETLEVLLRGLRRPYAYDLRRMYFDWRARCWRLHPGAADAEALFFAMLAQLDARRDHRVLFEIRELTESALDLARGRRTVLGHEVNLRLGSGVPARADPAG